MPRHERFPLHGNDDFQGVRFSCAPEGVISVQDLIQLEPMRDQPSWVNLLGPNGSESMGVVTVSTSRVVIGHILRPEPLKMKVDLGAMHANVGNDSARGDYILAQEECSRYTYGLNGGIDAAPVSQRLDRRGGFSVHAVDGLRGAKLAGEPQPVVV